MCIKNKNYEKVLYKAEVAITSLINAVDLFYPEPHCPDKYKYFDSNSFEMICDKAIDALSDLSKLNTNKSYSDDHFADMIYTELDNKTFFTLNTQVIIKSIKQKKENLLSIIRD